jgi:hypothetical protein
MPFDYLAAYGEEDDMIPQEGRADTVSNSLLEDLFLKSSQQDKASSNQTHH